jgi:hypothetical protein
LASAVFKSKRHDTGISPVLDITPPAGVTWDLEESGVTVQFIARLEGDPAPKMIGAAVVTGPWQCRYDPTPTDVDEAATYDVEVEVRRSDNKPVTFPTVGYLKWEIEPDLDDAA